MKNFNRDSGFNYKKGGGFKDGKKSSSFDGQGRRGPKSFERRGSDRSQGNSERPDMHQAVCADCGQSCQVPFRPISGKPVFCSNCFRDKAESGPRLDAGRKSSQSFTPRNEVRPAQPSGISHDQFEALNAKLDDIIAILGALAPMNTPALTEEEEIMKEINDFKEPKRAGTKSKKPVASARKTKK